MDILQRLWLVPLSRAALRAAKSVLRTSRHRARQSRFELQNGLLYSVRRYDRAEIYYSHWMAEESGTQYRPLAKRIAMLRAEYETRMTIRGPEVVELMYWLKVDGPAQEGESPRYPHLVIDIFERTGKRHTYFSDGGALWTGEGLWLRDVDATFRSKFTFNRLFFEACDCSARRP